MKPKAPEKPKISEHDVQTSILQWLRLAGYKAIRINSGALPTVYKGKARFVRFTDTVGVSDILFWGKGKSGAIEVKAPGWKPPKMTSSAWVHWSRQEEFLLDMQRHGQTGIVVTSLAEVQDALGWTSTPGGMVKKGW